MLLKRSLQNTGYGVPLASEHFKYLMHSFILTQSSEVEFVRSYKWRNRFRKMKWTETYIIICFVPKAFHMLLSALNTWCIYPHTIFWGRIWSNPINGERGSERWTTNKYWRQNSSLTLCCLSKGLKNVSWSFPKCFHIYILIWLLKLQELAKTGLEPTVHWTEDMQRS